jgi:ribonuclease BN (tRNA processing enzyme)
VTVSRAKPGRLATFATDADALATQSHPGDGALGVDRRVLVTSVCVVGSGDAFGSGGRLQTCFYVDAGATRILIDCGVTALIGLKRLGIDPGSIDVILVSHLHGDHFGGIGFIEREAQIEGTRTRPLLVAGPPGIEEAVRASLDAFFPGASQAPRTIPIEFVTYFPGQVCAVKTISVVASPVVHTSGTNAHALRVEIAGSIIAYSGDTEWTEGLCDIANGADLFICEAYTYERQRRGHMSLRTLESHRDQLTCRRLLLTHMSNDMLTRLPIPGFEIAYDGLVIVL